MLLTEALEVEWVGVLLLLFVRFFNKNMIGLVLLRATIQNKEMTQQG